VFKYQKDSVPPAAGKLKVWARVPVLGSDVDPIRAAYVPLWAVFTIAVTPVRLQPVKSPVSNPPLTITGVTVNKTVVEWVVEVPVPVTVTV
jgi:hypothetical protein